MNQRQRESIAKYLYDISKVTLAVAVIGNIASKERFDVWLLGWGLFAAVMTFLGASLIESTLKE